MNDHLHHYAAALTWQGNTGAGTRRYDGYQRTFEVVIPGKPTLRGSADAAFRGDAQLHNPEDLLLAAIASCHMLSYLALCARHRINVLAYSDQATAAMLAEAGGGRFTGVTLQPQVRIEDASQQTLALQLHEQAHRQCFIASSCNFPITHRPTVTTGDADASTRAGARLRRVIGEGSDDRAGQPAGRAGCHGRSAGPRWR